MSRKNQIAATLDGCPTCPYSQPLADPPDESVNPVVQGAVIAGAAVGVLALGAMIWSAFQPMSNARPMRTARRRPRAKMIRVAR